MVTLEASLCPTQDSDTRHRNRDRTGSDDLVYALSRDRHPGKSD